MKQPALIIPTSVEIAHAERHTLTNGVVIHALPSNDFEVLRLSFVFRAGSAMQNVPFSASATANLLCEGTQSMTAHQIAEQLDFYGSWFDVNIDRDYAYISFCTLSKFFRETLAVASEIILRPTFPQEEIAPYCTKRKQRLAIERQKVETQARERFASALFGKNHPYGISASESDYDNLTRDHIVDFHRRHYIAENCFVVCSGRINDEELAAISALAAQITHGNPPIATFPTPITEHDAVVNHAGAVQSSIRVGRLLFPRQHHDFLGMQVVATALGGYFGSRLMQNLREEHGFTYGVVAAMVNFEKEGYLAIATQVGVDVTQQALQEIYTEIERLRTEAMPDDELTLVKRMMIGEMMRILDGPFGIADVTIENILCDEPNSIIGENIRHINALTPTDVQQLAHQYLAREDLVTVIAGEQ